MSETRRGFIAGLVGAAGWPALAPLAGALGGCTAASAAGPAPIRWDRDTCAGCGMVIGDRRFAAEVETGPPPAWHKFDDIGCAISWLAAHARPASSARLWVLDPQDGTHWREASELRFARRRGSPMGYDYVAVAAGTAGIGYRELEAAIAAARQQRSAPAGEARS